MSLRIWLRHLASADAQTMTFANGRNAKDAGRPLGRRQARRLCTTKSAAISKDAGRPTDAPGVDAVDCRH